MLQGSAPNSHAPIAPLFLAVLVLYPLAKAGPELSSQKGNPEFCTLP